MGESAVFGVLIILCIRAGEKCDPSVWRVISYIYISFSLSLGQGNAYDKIVRGDIRMCSRLAGEDWPIRNQIGNEWVSWGPGPGLGNLSYGGSLGRVRGVKRGLEQRAERGPEVRAPSPS